MRRLFVASVVLGFPLPAWAVCGDGALDGSETCDDGNADAGDGCDAACAVEPGWNCVATEFILDSTQSLPDDGPHAEPNWTLSKDGRTISQSINSFSTVYASTLPMTGLTVTFTLTVNSSSDDDFIGWAFGWEDGELTAKDADWWVFDWKQTDQSYGDWGMAYDGLALSHVTGATAAADLWSHTKTVEEIARAATLGSTGWVDYTTYTIEMAFDVDEIQVWVDGKLEFDLTGEYPPSNFSFYAFSQEDVEYTLVEPSAATVCVALDTDGDGLEDPDEYEHGTDIKNPDTDGDGYGDAEEVENGTDPLDANDPDGPDDSGSDDSGTTDDSGTSDDSGTTDDSGVGTDDSSTPGGDDGDGDGIEGDGDEDGCGCGSGGDAALMLLPLGALIFRRRRES
jgi:MYXO-CTERM domain-containing protein